MSSNKKWILVFSIALAAILLVMGLWGKDEPSQTLTLNEKSMVCVETETPAVDETLPKEPEVSKKNTLDKPKSATKKTSAKEETGDEKNKKTDAKKHISDQENAETSSNSKKNKTDKARKTQHTHLPKTSGKEVVQAKEKGTTTQQVPSEVTATDEPQKKECTLLITCRSVLDHMDRLSENARKLIPENGIFLQGSYEIKSSDTVFDVLKRACSEKNILLDYVFTPIYSTYYIKGIGNLYELDCGEESGWMYQVDGNTPGYGCSQYKLNGGEEITFYYTCEK